MFYTAKEKKLLVEALNYLSEELDKVRARLDALEVKKESSPNLWGYKLDGTPKKKPGRKAQ